MTRKGFWIGFSYLFGLFTATIGWGSNNYTLAVSVTGLGFICFFALKKFREYVVTMTFAVLIGIGVNTLYTYNVYDKLTALDGKTVTINGYVDDYSYIGSDTCLVTVKGKINGVSAKVSFYVDNGDFDYYDKISVTGKVSKISDSINYTSESYLRPKGVYLQGGNAEKLVLDGENSNPLFREIKHYRNYLCTKIDDTVGGDEGAFLTAMLCGDKSELSLSMKTTMYHSGIGHLFAVSGTHLVIVTTLFSAILLRLLKWKKLNFALVMCEVWGFVIFAGMSVSVVRSAVMLTFLYVSFFFGRKADCANTLGICSILLTSFSPYTARDPSFLMSVFAAFAVGAVAPRIISSLSEKHSIGKTVQSMIVVITVLLVTIPLNIFFFDGVSVISPISNLIIVPVATVALQVAFLVVLSGGIGFIAVPLLLVAKYLVKLVIILSQLFAQIPYSYISSSKKALCVVMVLTCLIPIVFTLKSKNLKRGTLVTAIVFFIWTCTYNFVRIVDNDIKLVALPASNGCVYVVYKGESCFVADIGCGGKNDKGFERFMSNNGITRIDFAVVTDKVYYTMSMMSDDLSVKPQKYFLKSDDTDSGDVYYVSNNAILEFSELCIEIEENSVVISDDKTSVSLGKKSYILNGSMCDLTEQDYPVEINLSDNTSRYLDYNF